MIALRIRTVMSSQTILITVRVSQISDKRIAIRTGVAMHAIHSRTIRIA